MNGSGAYVWAGSMGGRDFDGGLGIALDAAGNVHVNGFSNNDPEADFDPGRGKLNLPCSGSCGFVVKLDPNRNLLWGQSGVGRYGIAVDGAGAVYTTGAGIFVSQLNSAGSLVWAGGPGVGVGSEGIAVDGQGNVFIAGSFSGTVDFDPGASTYSLSSTLDSSGNPTSDVFVSKLVPSSGVIAAATAVRQSSPKVTGHHTLGWGRSRDRASLGAFWSHTPNAHEHDRHHAARTQAADQAIASLLGSAMRRRFGSSRRLDLDLELFDIETLV